jgi:hypothetical protein
MTAACRNGYAGRFGKAAALLTSGKDLAMIDQVAIKDRLHDLRDAINLLEMALTAAEDESQRSALQSGTGAALDIVHDLLKQQQSPQQQKAV